MNGEKTKFVQILVRLRPATYLVLDLGYGPCPGTTGTNCTGGNPRSKIAAEVFLAILGTGVRSATNRYNRYKLSIKRCASAHSAITHTGIQQTTQD